MPHPNRSPASERPTASCVGLCALFVLLVLAGGASRPDTAGQVVVRFASVIALAASALLAPRPQAGAARWVVGLLLMAIALPLAQLVPLPFELWRQLPGRAMLAVALPDPSWRPLSMSPSATVNAATALIVPLAVVVLALGAKAREHDRLPALLLGLVAVSAVAGALQFAGAGLNNPFVNDRRGTVAGFFANRNHFALFLAIGCLVAPVWALQEHHRRLWRGPVALALVVLFLLVILSTGSRAGVLLGVAGLGMGLAITWRRLNRQLLGLPRRLRVALAAGGIGSVALIVLLSVGAGRADSLKRAMAMSIGEDMRLAALPTVLDMVKAYFPVGTGFGSFEQVFHIHEPFQLLKPTNFNQAHDDLLAIVLDGGIAGLLLLLAALGWWARASIRLWRSRRSDATVLGQLGSAILLLVAGASAVDYPARTPVVMGLIAVAALWLAWGADPARIDQPRPAPPDR